jgi:outer membrane protein OmpA-like peptidoglycan-associated protein
MIRSLSVVILAVATLLVSANRVPSYQGVLFEPNKLMASFPEDISGTWDGQMQGEMNGELISTVGELRLDIAQTGEKLLVKSTYHSFNEEGAEFQYVTRMTGTYKNGEVQLKTKDVDDANTFAIPNPKAGISYPVAVAYNYRMYGTVRQDGAFLVFNGFRKLQTSVVISGKYPKRKLGLAMDYGHNPIKTPRAVVFKRFVGEKPRPGIEPVPGVVASNPYEREVVEEEFRNILFVQGSTQFLTEEDSRKVDQLGRALQQHPEWRVILHGHTQQAGTEEKNQTLSENRSDLVRDLLIRKFNISSKRIATKGYGSATPEVRRESEQNKYLNRRVEIEIAR